MPLPDGQRLFTAPCRIVGHAEFGPNDDPKVTSHLTILDSSVTVPDIVRFIETSHFQTLSKAGHETLDKELANINLNTKKEYDVIDVFSILPKIHNLK